MKCVEVGSALFLLAIGLLFVGCDQSSSPGGSDVHADSESHKHGSAHDHSHPHTHGHRHGEPLHGGRIVTIGHSHHGSGETHYHGEVMPVEDGRITFHVMTGNDESRSEPFDVEATKTVAYVDRSEKESARAQEVFFSSQGDQGGSTLVATIPESLLDCKQLFVVVPEIKLGGQRLSFSFTTPTTDEK